MNTELNSIKGKKVLVIGDAGYLPYREREKDFSRSPRTSGPCHPYLQCIGRSGQCCKKSVGTGLLAVCRQPAWQRPQRKHNAGDVR